VFEVKHRNSAIVSIIAIIALTILFSVTADAGWVILLFPLSAIIGTLIGFVLAPLFLWIYKKYMGRNHLFAIQDPESMEKPHGMLMGFFPALLATNLALILIFDSNVMSMPLFQDYYLQWNTIVFLFFILGALLQAPAFALFSAAWIIDESGIVLISKYGTAELQATGKWFLALLKGYAGIGVIIALYQFIFEFLGTYGSLVHYSAILFLFILPIIATVWVFPAILIVGVTETRRRDYILGFAKRFGFRTEFELQIRRIEEHS